MNELEYYIRCEIQDSGYLSALQIMIRLVKRKSGIKKDEIDSILSTIPCAEIHKISYTNSYTRAIKFKDLYYYNPSPTSKSTTPKRRKKVSAKKKTNILQSP